MKKCEKPIVLNLYGGPGCGKSTTSAGVFSILKLHGVNAEYVPEFAKDLTWEKRLHTLKNQRYVWGKQHHRLFRLEDQVDVIITDSPLMLSVMYARMNGYEGTKFLEAVIESYNEFNNVNFILSRVKEYNPKGRNQSESEAKILDHMICKTLDEYEMEYLTVEGSFEGINAISSIVLEGMLGLEQKIIFSKNSA